MPFSAHSCTMPPWLSREGAVLKLRKVRSGASPADWKVRQRWKASL